MENNSLLKLEKQKESKKENPILFDNFKRKINYLRLAVTDRCNLRCFYCMPKNGIPNIACQNILRYEEILRIVNIFSSLGIDKVRITGGEPFVRKGLIDLLIEIRKIGQIKSLNITTNGVLIKPYLKKLKEINISTLNLSLDSLKRDTYKLISGSDSLNTVLENINEIIKLEIPLKINVVVNKYNETEILDFVEFTKNKNLSVRFIEQMSFNGKMKKLDKFSTKDKILNNISKKHKFSQLKFIEGTTASLYKIDNFKGNFGIIAGNTRKFCNSCNKLRITSSGTLKNCLYELGKLNLKNLIRDGLSDEQIKNHIISNVMTKKIDGQASEMEENSSLYNSMALIGG